MPDLIIEVVSSNRENDFILKRDLYEKQGVLEYLIIDPKDKTVYQYVLLKHEYRSPKEYDFSEEITLQIIEGMSLKLDII